MIKAWQTGRTKQIAEAVQSVLFYWRKNMPKRVDLAGRVFGRLTVAEFSHTDARYNAYWKCQCACGKEIRVVAGSLTHGRTQSCGCLHREVATKRFTSHGLSGTSEYHIWAGIKGRCENPEHPNHAHYGGRGIRLFPAWVNDFKAFYDYIGPRPSMGHTVDRIENSKGYEPGNVRWANNDLQANNKTSNNVIERDGVKKNLTEWARELGISPSAIMYRINNGWPEDQWLVPVRTNPAREGNPTHYASYTPEYEAWHAMKVKYAAEVCLEWLENPAAFLDAVGQRPGDDYVFTRIDVAKLFAPGNVKWITRKEKQRNLPTNKFCELNGVRKTVAEWAEIYGIERRRLAQRLRQGWELAEALTTPFAAKTLLTG